MYVMHEKTKSVGCICCYCVAAVRRRETAEAIRRVREVEEARIRAQQLKDLARIEQSQSEYRREVVERHLPSCLRVSYDNAKYPCSPWWRHYLRCLVSKAAAVVDVDRGGFCRKEIRRRF